VNKSLTRAEADRAYGPVVFENSEVVIRINNRGPAMLVTASEKVNGCERIKPTRIGDNTLIVWHEAMRHLKNKSGKI
jgi:hypothetical protein